MDFNYAKLKGKIKEVCGTQQELAKDLGIARTSMSHKLTNKSEFSQQEIKRSTEILGINIEEIPIYFFNELVHKHEQKSG